MRHTIDLQISSATGDSTFVAIAAMNIGAALQKHGVTVNFKSKGRKMRNPPFPSEVHLPNLTANLSLS